MDDPTLCAEELLACLQALHDSGLSPGTSGNASVRFGKNMLITPSGIKPQNLTPPQMVPLSLEGEVLLNNDLKPSSEWRFHAQIYSHRNDVDAIVHCHSHYATALACAGREIPAFHYMVACAGGNNICCAPYAPSGSEELSANIVAALSERQAALLGNHGQISVGKTLEKALDLALEVENLARTYTLCREDSQLQVLSDAEMNTVLDRFTSYGQQASH